MMVGNTRATARTTMLRLGSVAAVAALPAAVLAGPSTAAPQVADPEPPPLSVFLGNTHAHTGAGNDHGEDDSTAGDVLATAKANGFDFFLLTEHSGPTGPSDPASFYADAQAQAAALTEPGVFVGLAGYEYSDNGGDGDDDRGHLTAFGSDDFVSAVQTGMTFDAFFDYMLGQAETRRGFLGFNHPGPDGHAAAEKQPATDTIRRLVALSETSNGGSYDADHEAAFYKGYLAELDRGWRVAPTCGLDGHGLFLARQRETESKKPCRTGLLAVELTRPSVITAIKQRRVYATRDTNLRAKYSANGRWMGSAIGEPTEVRFDIEVHDPDTGDAGDAVRRIEVVGRGGTVLDAQSFDGHDVSWSPTVPAGDHDYMLVRVFTGERSGHTAVLAPVWLE